MISNWRDCKAWEKEGLGMSTTSNEACKLYDASLSQLIGWYDDPVLGGLASSCGKLLAADPDFVMGKVFVYGLELVGTGKSIRSDKTFKKDMEDLVTLATRVPVTSRESLHVRAVNLWANGQLRKATDVWEQILIDYPEDALALKMAHDSYFFLGNGFLIRDSLARVFPRWKRSNPLYGYLHGMYAFGLEETNLYSEALKHGQAGLEINKRDAWATHACAHVMEMTGRQEDGIKFMEETESDWSICGMLACHNYWHLALYYLDKGNCEAVLDLYDTHIGNRVNESCALLDIVDAASLLYRLQLENVNVGNRWKSLFSVCKPHLEDNILVFNDVHFVMAALGCHDDAAAATLLSSMKQLINVYGDYDEAVVAKNVGYDLCRAFVEYDKGNYDKVVEMLHPLRYKIVDIGGSHAQRDVFHLLLINASLKSPNKHHQKLARALLFERKALKENSGLTDRLMGRLLACHTE